MKQPIIARKDLRMSPGKLAAQVSHASKEYLFPPEKEGEIRNLIKESTKHLFLRPNDDVEFIIPFLMHKNIINI